MIPICAVGLGGGHHVREAVHVPSGFLQRWLRNGDLSEVDEGHGGVGASIADTRCAFFGLVIAPFACGIIWDYKGMETQQTFHVGDSKQRLQIS